MFFVGYYGIVTPKVEGQIPSNAGYVQIGMQFVLENIANNYTQVMEFGNADIPIFSNSGMQTDKLSDGTTRWRWEVRSWAPFSPEAQGDRFLQVFEIFSGNTVAQTYKSPFVPVAVRADTVYYTQSLDRSEWNMAPSATGVTITNNCILDVSIDDTVVEGFNATNQIQVSVKSQRLNLWVTQSLRPSVDGNAATVSWDGIVQPSKNGRQTALRSITTIPRPNDFIALLYEFRVTSPSGASVGAKSKASMPGYKKSAIAVGIVFGVPAVAIILGFSVYFFCLGAWLPIWAVISRPGRAVQRKFHVWRSPPAPRFQADDDDDEDEDEDDPLNFERVGADEILKMTGGVVGTAASGGKGSSRGHDRQPSGDHVLSRLRKAMGRRLSNFVGWDGPGDAASSDKLGRSSEKSPGKKGKKGMTSSPSQSAAETIDHPASGDDASYYAQPSAAAASSSAVGLMATEDDDDDAPELNLSGSTGHLPLGYSSGDDDTQTGQYSPLSSPPGSRPETPVRARPEARAEDVSPSRAKKPAPGGLRGFKITSNSSTNILASAQADSSAPQDDNVE